MPSDADYEFDRATHSTLAGEDGTRREYTGLIHDGWDINGNANGGYLLAIAAAAMRDASGRPDPLTISAHYLAPGRPGACVVHTDLAKQGRQLVTVAASMHGSGREILRLLGSFGDISAMSGGFGYVSAAPPSLPSPDACLPRSSEQGAVTVELMHRLDVRLDPATAAFQQGVKSGVAEIAGWIQFRDGRPIDSLAMLLFLDAFPPPVFNIDVPPGWVPTVELTAHVRGTPARGPLMARFHTEFVQNGMLQEDGELWDSDGQLVAQSRQLAMLPRVP